MKTIRQVISTKGTDVARVAPDVTAVEAIKAMTEKNIGSMLVMDGDKVVGIFTEKDFSRNVVMTDRLGELIAVTEVMVSPVIAIQPGQSIEEALAIMTEKRVRHLPVMEDETLIGLVSIGDLVKAVIAEQEFTIKQLEQYIYC